MLDTGFRSRSFAITLTFVTTVALAHLLTTILLVQHGAIVETVTVALIGMALLILAVMTQRASAAPGGQTREDRNLGQLLNDLPDLVFEVDARGVVTYVSDGSEWLLGFSPAEMIGRRLLDFIAKDEHERLELRLDSLQGGGPDQFRSDMVFCHADGSLRTTNAVGRTVRSANGRLQAVRGGLRDISDRIEAEAALRASETRLRTVLETAQSGIMIVQRDGGLSLYNRALCEMLGYSWGELSQLAIRDLIEADGSTSAATALSQPMWTGDARVQREERLWRKDGTPLAVDLSISAYREQGEVVGVLVEARDITHRKESEETIERLAFYDRLTGLPNRTLFDRRLMQALAAADRDGLQVGVLLCDLDEFKIVNDTLGHQLGDRLLSEVAERLAAAVDRPHTLARPGGDEFMLLLPGITAASDAAVIAERLLASLEQPFTIDGHRLHVDASIGITIGPDDGAEPDSLLRRADTAMYQAKRHRRNLYRFYTAAQDEQAERLELETGMRQALEDREFVLHYQPVFDQGGGTQGVEALLRWQHPDRGLVPPDDFIPHLEETGMIIDVGAWVLREACAQLQRWRAAGVQDRYVAVNLSARQFQDESLVEVVASALADSGTPPGCLVVEVTETAVMQDVEAAVAMLERLRAIGVETLLDDFGTGHSSLSQLKRLPVYGLKIDQSFVKDIEHDTENQAIVTSIASLGRALGLHVIAEGVETEAQRAFLGSLAVDALQGYLFARPMPSAQLHGWPEVGAAAA